MAEFFKNPKTKEQVQKEHEERQDLTPKGRFELFTPTSLASAPQ